MEKRNIMDIPSENMHVESGSGTRNQNPNQDFQVRNCQST